MAYDVDFWYQSQNACQITTTFTPFSDDKEESIYMDNEDFFAMVDQFSDASLMYEAWRILRSQLEGESKQKMLELEENLGIDVDKELKNIYERSIER
ncbi:hypothetical protein MN112_12125 [Staphylococcus epidermidis]|uniref:hypothetical protein n=1 Tax=Staphylococcus TaxID=1279 RepID=UPI0008A983AC|nr:MULTISPECIES: hypothetical protein [Staphylococcus]MCG1698229.1 hypothetical protein [Staphylococcus epidermidis]MCG2484777.1 hypothetical protein [Staphylococcus epidermidis]MCG2547766.1 hypothetical protein [Staphylococcus epidermidis]MCH9557336.1 hypothetical protein [Staphylococcus epidermidis]MCH9571593.1 hypothetical protein [Staphylococcus epidermidis]